MIAVMSVCISAMCVSSCSDDDTETPSSKNTLRVTHMFDVINVGEKSSAELNFENALKNAETELNDVVYTTSPVAIDKIKTIVWKHINKLDNETRYQIKNLKQIVSFECRVDGKKIDDVVYEFNTYEIEAETPVYTLKITGVSDELLGAEYFENESEESSAKLLLAIIKTDLVGKSFDVEDGSYTTFIGAQIAQLAKRNNIDIQFMSSKYNMGYQFDFIYNDKESTKWPILFNYIK